MIVDWLIKLIELIMSERKTCARIRLLSEIKRESGSFACF
jgi:hypothetical protein